MHDDGSMAYFSTTSKKRVTTKNGKQLIGLIGKLLSVANDGSAQKDSTYPAVIFLMRWAFFKK